MYIDTERISTTQMGVKGAQATLASLSFVEMHEGCQRQLDQVNDAVLKKFEMIITEDASLNEEKCTFQYPGSNTVA
jgi:hypothetical protein